MKMEDKHRKIQQKANVKKYFQKVKHQLIMIGIGYPFVIPYMKIEEALKRGKRNYWRSNLHKLREKCLGEMIHYIEKEMLDEDDIYYVYNARCYEDIRSTNGFFLQEFISYSWHYRSKHRKWSVMYLDLHNGPINANFSAKEFFKSLHTELCERIQTHYQDIEVTENPKECGFRHLECFSMKIKK